jgi:hypothetical protein
MGYFPGLIYAFGVFLFTDTETTVVSSEVTVERGGSVYVLTNPALSDVVKIGYATRSAEERARELTLAAGWTKVGRRSSRCIG